MTTDQRTLRERLAGVARRSTCRLTHYGRKSGRPHQVTVWFLVDGDAVYLVTADRRRQWVRNVLARPSVELRMGAETFLGEVEPLTCPTEAAPVLELLREKYCLARLYLWLKGPPDGVFRVRLHG